MKSKWTFKCGDEMLKLGPGNKEQTSVNISLLIKLWNQVPAEALKISPVNYIFLERGLGK